MSSSRNSFPEEASCGHSSYRQCGKQFLAWSLRSARTTVRTEEEEAASEEVVRSLSRGCSPTLSPLGDRYDSRHGSAQKPSILHLQAPSVSESLAPAELLS